MIYADIHAAVDMDVEVDDVMETDVRTGANIEANMEIE